MMDNIIKECKFIEDIKQIKAKRHALTTSGKPFSDKDFPTDIGIDALSDYTIQWKRLKDLETEPQLYKDGCPTKGDMEQGLIEDRPLIAVLSAIANHPKLMNYIFPPGQDFSDSSYSGLFYFRFWKMGKWVYIIVDDKVPIVGNKKTEEPKKKDKTKGKDIRHTDSNKTITTDSAKAIKSTSEIPNETAKDAAQKTSQQQIEIDKEGEKATEEKNESKKPSTTQQPPQIEEGEKRPEDTKLSVNPQPSRDEVPKPKASQSQPSSGTEAAAPDGDAKSVPTTEERETKKNDDAPVTVAESPKESISNPQTSKPSVNRGSESVKEGPSDVKFDKKESDVKPDDKKFSHQPDPTPPHEPSDPTKIPESLDAKQSSKRMSEFVGKPSMISRGSTKHKEVELESEISNRSNNTIFVRVFGEGKVYYWATLLEKACAKAYGGYNQLPKISVTETLLDLTGGVTEIFFTSHLPRGFFLDFKNYSDSRSIILAATNLPNTQEEEAEPKYETRTDLFAVTSVILADFRQSLGRDKIVGFVRLFNPYGEIKWMDPWKETSQEWKVLPPLVTSKLKMESRGIGEFYLTYSNFLRAFSALIICTVPDGDNFNSEGYFGEWMKPKVQYNLCRIDDLRFHEFPQHKIWVRDPNAKDTEADVVVSLVQNGRCCCSENPFYNVMQLFLFCMDMDRTHTLPLSFEFFRYNRPIGCSNVSSGKEVTARFKISQGHYLVVPVIDCPKILHPCQANDYVLRVITPAKFPKPPPPPLSTFTDSENLNIYFDLAETIEEPKAETDESSKASIKVDTEKAGHKEKGRGRKKKVKH